MADFIFLIFIPPVILFMYYAGFVALAKLKINQPDKGMKIHVQRFFSGFAVFSIIAILVLLVRWIIAPLI